MEMPENSLPGSDAAKDQSLNEASATVADAGTIDTEEELVASAGDDGVPEDPEAAAEELMTEGEQEPERLPHAMTPEELLEAAKALLDKDAAEVSNDEIRRLRQHFLSICKKAGIADPELPETGETAEATPLPDGFEVNFQDVYTQLKEKKTEWSLQQAAIKAANLERKNAIIEEILALAEDTDNVNRTFPRYRELQDEFNAVGEVEQSEDTSVWKRFQEARERYSDNLKINKELRDYDFKKNLAEKEVLLEEARGLVELEDVIAAYRRLQELHNKWRQIGPVAKELRDEIWNKFRDASAEVNKRYQAFFEARKDAEAANEAAKTVLCERIEALDFSGLKSYSAWDEMTAKIIEAQNEWKTLGFASRKANRQLFSRFRATCDKFFAAKADFYRNSREELSRNLVRKQELADRAEALKDSTDWKKTTDEFLGMQKEWKTIGAVPKKYSDALWKRFTAACDYFFGQKKASTSGVRKTESANLKAKREIIGLISALASSEDREAALEEFKALQDRWQQTGHVPFREKDKVYEAYRNAVDAVRDRFDLIRSKARMNRFQANVAEIEGDDNKLFRERERLLRISESRRNELRTYENNLGFLSSKSKSGESLVHDLQRRIERLKADIVDLDEKISLIDSKLSE